VKAAPDRRGRGAADDPDPDTQRLSARDNPLLVRLRRLARDPTAYRRQGQVWIEGEHLCRALLDRGQRPALALIADSAWARPELRSLAQAAPQRVRVADALFASVSALPSPAALGFAWPLPARQTLRPQAASVVLDRIQDAGNAGSILRSAAAFGIEQVLALQGTAALWSPKVLRAGMGAHFALHLVEALTAADLDGLRLPLVGTRAGAPDMLHRCTLPARCAWVFGHEGQGVAPELLARCAQVVGIAQPGGEESLNVAAAAAVCLHEALRQRLAQPDQ
jgi:TrmH family RNA methyltransferase